MPVLTNFSNDHGIDPSDGLVLLCELVTLSEANKVGVIDEKQYKEMLKDLLKIFIKEREDPNSIVRCSDCSKRGHPNLCPRMIEDGPFAYKDLTTDYGHCDEGIRKGE